MRLETAVPDVVHLASYYQSIEGVCLAKALAPIINKLYLHTPNHDILSLGYGRAVIHHMVSKPQNVIQAMLLNQGIEDSKDALHHLVSPDCLPFVNGRFSCVMMIHWLEFCSSPLEALNELWRVTMPGGRVICIVPNALSLRPWPQPSPFNRGKAWLGWQLASYLQTAGFKLTETYPFLPVFGQAFLPSKLLVMDVQKSPQAPISLSLSKAVPESGWRA